MSAVAPRPLLATSAPHRLCVAPMMGRTDRHFRYLVRRLTRRTLLYTEMIAAPALVRGEPRRLLAHHPDEQPLALQVGGSDPELLAECARLAAAHGFVEINLNCGCPSERVTAGRFGASLMREPERVAECVAAMAGALPVTVKCRLGVDDLDRYPDLARFVAVVAAAGCRTFIVHARKAWLRGVSPRRNRELPPLRPDWVARLKRERPDLEVVSNGGVSDLGEALARLTEVDGVMIGRAAYRDPYLLAEADRRVFGEAAPVPTRAEAAAAMLPYLERETAAGTPAVAILRHLMGLYAGRPGARAWRRLLGAAPGEAGGGGAGERLRAALAHVEGRR